MNYLLDTNVISELFKPSPNPQVTKWLESVDQDSLHLSVLTVGEIRKGVETMDAGPKKKKLLSFLDQELPARFADRLLPVDLPTAERWGTLEASAKRPLSTIDALLAATALSRQLTLVTRNTADFQFPDLPLLNPWER